MNMRKLFGKLGAATLFVGALGTVNAIAAHSGSDDKLCLGSACLGMTVEELAKLNLQSAGTFKMQFKKSAFENTYGISPSGQRVWFEGKSIDQTNAREFANRISYVCSGQFLMAKLKASDGQEIQIALYPAIVNGKGTFAVYIIDRFLPPNMSPSAKQEFEAQAREKYGNAYEPNGVGMSPLRPSAGIHLNTGRGTSLRLAKPIVDVRQMIMEQPGCSDRAKLD